MNENKELFFQIWLLLFIADFLKKYIYFNLLNDFNILLLGLIQLCQGKFPNLSCSLLHHQCIQGYSTWYSQAVIYLDTDQARHFLTLVIVQELVSKCNMAVSFMRHKQRERSNYLTNWCEWVAEWSWRNGKKTGIT